MANKFKQDSVRKCGSYCNITSGRRRRRRTEVWMGGKTEEGERKKLDEL